MTSTATGRVSDCTRLIENARCSLRCHVEPDSNAPDALGLESEEPGFTHVLNRRSDYNPRTNLKIPGQ
jgi:hypothetical protein